MGEGITGLGHTARAMGAALNSHFKGFQESLTLVFRLKCSSRNPSATKGETLLYIDSSGIHGLVYSTRIHQDL